MPLHNVGRARAKSMDRRCEESDRGVQKRVTKVFIESDIEEWIYCTIRMRYPKHQMRNHDGDLISDNWLKKHQVVIHVGGQPTQCEDNDNGDQHFDCPPFCDFS